MRNRIVFLMEMIYNDCTGFPGDHDILNEKEILLR